MAYSEYTLTGFSPFLEQLRIAFAEPLPADYVCSTCGRVSADNAVLPCGHIVCGRRLSVHAGAKPVSPRRNAVQGVRTRPSTRPALRFGKTASLLQRGRHEGVRTLTANCPT
ncbi:hypothetical protein MRX96_024668 [Rhipicephalus microplus]